MAQTSEKTAYYYKLFRVKRSDGRITTVSLDPALVTKACRMMGGLKAVAAEVRASAYAYAEGGVTKSCSGHVQSHLQVLIAAKGKSNASTTAEVRNSSALA